MPWRVHFYIINTLPIQVEVIFSIVQSRFRLDLKHEVNFKISKPVHFNNNITYLAVTLQEYLKSIINSYLYFSEVSAIQLLFLARKWKVHLAFHSVFKSTAIDVRKWSAVSVEL